MYKMIIILQIKMMKSVSKQGNKSIIIHPMDMKCRTF
jgi:hypothetical protein